MDDTSNEVNYSVEDLKQILVDVMPLLESIDIMQVEVDNELKIGQQNVKVKKTLATMTMVWKVIYDTFCLQMNRSSMLDHFGVNYKVGRIYTIINILIAHR